MLQLAILELELFRVMTNCDYGNGWQQRSRSGEEEVKQFRCHEYWMAILKSPRMVAGLKHTVVALLSSII